MRDFTEILSHPLGPWTWGQLLSGLGLVVGAFVLRALFTRWVGRRVVALALRTRSEADDVAAHALIAPLGWAIPMIGLYAAFRLLAADQPPFVDLGDKVFMVILTLLITWTAFKCVDAAAIFAQERSKHGDGAPGIEDALIPTIRKAIKAFLAVVVFLLIAQNLGYSITGLLGALGVGGLAVALAAKDTLANLFGSITILIDRPFRPGDWITFDDSEGVVEEIGLRSTRIRTFAKTVVSVPNSVLANATVNNFSKMPRRRIMLTAGVTYETRPDQMREAVARIEAWLRGNAEIDQNFMMVKFTEFGPSSLDILVYCFTITTQWAEYLRVKQDTLLAIMDILEGLGLSIAFPTRTVHLAGATPPEAAEAPAAPGARN